MKTESNEICFDYELTYKTGFFDASTVIFESKLKSIFSCQRMS